MTARAGERFDVGRAAAETGALLTAPVPAGGETSAEGDPATGEWTATVGAGFRIVPLWEGDPLTGVYAPEWNDAEEAAEAQLAELAAALEADWGPRRKIHLHGPLLRWQSGSPVEPLHAALFAEDLYGDLEVWGPIAPTGRWIGITLGHSDGDAPLVLAALVSEQAITEPPESAAL